MLHSQLIHQTGGTAGVRDFNLLESAIETPFQVFGGEELYPTIQAKGALNKPSFRRLFFSIQIPSLKSTYSVLKAIVKEDFLHRLHIYRYPFCKGSSAFPHRFCLGVLKYIECLFRIYNPVLFVRWYVKGWRETRGYY